MTIQLDKGGRAEEILRNYFRELGYFVVRGVKVKIEGVDITDLDLWLYNRPSPITRERINVEVKNRKSPQALERVFWAKGVQSVLGFDACIVATTDKRREVIEFGRQHGVIVLDGAFLAKLNGKNLDQYLFDEDFRARSDQYRQSKALWAWYDKAAQCSSLLAVRLGYDACNSLVPEIQFFLEQIMTNEARREEAIRYTYLLLSYFLIGLDFSLAEVPFLSSEERQNHIEEGLRYGQ